MHETKDAKREAHGTDPVQTAIDNGRFVCPMLARACVEDACMWYVSYSSGCDYCAVALMGEAQESMRVSTHNIASCM